MGEILIGTSGYSYEDWVGPFYPEILKKSDKLKHYALFFPYVELNFSYYRMPTPQGLRNLVNQTHESFLFSIKAHASLTHEISNAFKDDVKLFRDAVSVLASSNRLACVLLQFPYRFHHTTENRLYLADLAEELKEFPLAVEWRNDEWNTARVYDALQKRNIARVVTDLPNLPGLPPLDIQATADLQYVRFHGRNTTSFWSGDNVSRYDYLYSSVELEPWVPRVKKMADKSKQLFVAFNNHHKGQAIQNAKELRSALDFYGQKH